MKLSKDELRDAHRHVGELFIEGSAAYLCAGRPSEWPDHGHVLPPLYRARVTTLRGDDFIVAGEVLRDAISIHANYVQAWWCRPASGT